MKVFEISVCRELYTYKDPWGKDVKVSVGYLHQCRHLSPMGSTVPWTNPWTEKVEQHEVWQDDATGQLFRKDPPLDYYAGSTFCPLFEGSPEGHWYYARPSGRLVWAETKEPVNIIPD